MSTPIAENPILDTDSYKASHWLQYPPDSFDIFHAVENVWCGDLLDMVRASGGNLVVRPDFGLLPGDRINDESIGEILHAVKSRGYSTSNIDMLFPVVGLA